MSYVDKDLEELLEEQASIRVSYQHPLDIAVGDTVYSRNHRIQESTLLLAGGVPARIQFSRFYFLLAPKVAIDYEVEAGGEQVVAAKRDWCEAKSVRYVLVKDEFDVSPFIPDPALAVSDRSPARPAKAMRARRKPS